MRETGGRAHVLHLSDADALPLLAEARDEGLRVTVETCPHYLTLEAEDIPDGATQFKCCPPIRERANRDLLWEGLASGVIGTVVTDHSPSTADLKLLDVGDFGQAWGGIAGLQLGLPAVWTEARRRGHGLPDVVRWMGRNTADQVGLTDRGRIEVGRPRRPRRLRARRGRSPSTWPRCTTRTPCRPTPAARSPAWSGRPGSTAHRSTSTPTRAAGCSPARHDERTGMTQPRYYAPRGGLPAQTDLTTDRATFTEAYAVLPRGTMRDIVTSALPFWEDTRLWVIARPLSGLRRDVLAVHRRGVARRRQRQARAGPGRRGRPLRRRGRRPAHDRGRGARPRTRRLRLPARRLHVDAARPTRSETARFHWIRKAYERVEGIDVPEPFVTNEVDVPGGEMPGTEGRWTTQRFVDPADVRHDMHVNIVNFEPGGVIPFPETHVMEHGLYVLEGKAVYLLNNDWVEVQEGDFMWLRAFCPQACYAGGPGRFRYLLYKDVNRHAKLPRHLSEFRAKTGSTS